jgi:uncharacterized protein
MTRLRRLVLGLVLLPGLAFAQDFPAPLADYVSDYAEVLDPGTEARITDTLTLLQADTGVEVRVVTLSRQTDYGSDTRIEDFAKDWFNAWGIGDATRNDGILILVAVEDRAMRIALGAGYPVIYDGRAQRVIDTAMLPEFREGRYAEGIEAGAIATGDLLARPFAEQQEVTADSGFAEPADPGGLPNWMAAIALLGAVVMVFRRRASDAMVRLKRCPSCGTRGLSRHRSTITPATGAHQGTGLLTTGCRNCSYHREDRYTLPSKSSRSGGSGGGRSSGGGATGRW